MNEQGTFLLWAKTTSDRAKDATVYHPLLCHMIDVAAVAGLVWDHCLSKLLRDKIERSLSPDPRAKLIFFAAAHDIGKASPGFQKKRPELSAQCLLQFSQYDQDRPHGLISTKVLYETFGVASAVMSRIAGAHHGVFPRSEDLQMSTNTLGNNSWTEARRQLLNELAGVLGFDVKEHTLGATLPPSIVPVLAGFISVVDWIGSNQEFFPCAARIELPLRVNAADYWKGAQEKAQKALEILGWLPPVAFATAAEFKNIFRNLTPNSLQTAVIELASQHTSPYLMIIEAPMGLGKTEAALFAADLAMCRGFARGLYVAMPSQATGNSMFTRVLNEYLKQRGHKGKLNLQLVHADAVLARNTIVAEGEIADFTPKDVGDGADVEAQSWFTARKRPLLAPFGVGTIDQTLLSVLQTKHWFVRLFGLAGKVVIFDEVHAYDAYMNTMFERLLRWLAEVDCTVIVLSATLPDARRKALVKAYSGRDDGEDKRYPRITLATRCCYPDTQSAALPISVEVLMPESREVNLGFVTTGFGNLTNILTEELQEGGCAAVICDTVDRSIQVFKDLRDNMVNTECLLFHARTLQMWRRKREAEVLRKFGKGEKQADGYYANPHRPKKSVLVATQVVEQSLDLDFDLMISEIAPVDLLLQRSGRLHRHVRWRPGRLRKPHFIILSDAQTDGPPPDTFGKNIEFVYDRYILLRTWLAIRERTKFVLPDEIEMLVSMVYGDSPQQPDEKWNDDLTKAKKEMEMKRSESEKSAAKLLICRPKDPMDLIEDFNSQLEEDEDPRTHEMVRAATREGDPSITVVMLAAGGALSSNPDIHEVRSLLEQSTRISKRGLFHLLVNQGECPKEWKTNPHLRHSRLMRLDPQGRGYIGDYVLTADEALGIVIEKGGDNE